MRAKYYNLMMLCIKFLCDIASVIVVEKTCVYCDCVIFHFILPLLNILNKVLFENEKVFMFFCMLLLKNSRMHAFSVY